MIEQSLPQYLRRRDYAQARGLTAARVSQLEKRGLIKITAGFVDVVRSDAAIEDELRPRTTTTVTNGANGAAQPGANGDARPGDGANVRQSRAASLIAAQARAAEARARLTELKVEQARGELVSVAEVTSLVQIAFTEARAALLAMPERCVARVRDAASEHQARLLLEQDVRATLQRCVDRLRQRFAGEALTHAKNTSSQT